MAGDAVPPVLTESTAYDDFVAFVGTHTDTLLRTAYLLTGDPASAEDVVQDTLTRLYPKWSRVQRADHPVAYVRRSLINTYLNGRRSASARELVLPDLTAHGFASDQTDRIATRDQLWRLLQTLPYRQRAALVLRYFDDLPDREVARSLGCRVGTARSLVSRGLAALRETVPGGDPDA